MNHNNYGSYRQNLDLFKVLIGTNLVLLKLLFVLAHYCLAGH